MRAHVIENQKVVNTIIVDSLDVLPNLVEATQGEIGDLYVNGVFTKSALDLASLAANVRKERDNLLAATDWTQVADVLQSLKDKWAPYRQALRDLPQQPGFPENIQWPVKPE